MRARGVGRLILGLGTALVVCAPASARKQPAFTDTLSGHKGPVFSVAFSPDGSKILSASFDNTLKLWDAKSGNTISTWEGHTDNVRAVAFSPDGTRAVSGGSDRKVMFWNTESGTEAGTLGSHEGIIRAVAYSPDGNTVVSGSDDKSIKLWQVAGSTTPKLLATWTGHTDGVNALAFSPDGKTVLSGSVDSSVGVWDVASGQGIFLKGHSAPVLTVAFSPNGAQAFSSGEDKVIRVWDLETKKTLSQWTGHTEEVHIVAISPDGKVAISAGYDKVVKVWDIPSRQLSITVPGNDANIYAADFDPIGKRAVLAVGDELRFFDLSSLITVQPKNPQKLTSKVTLIEPPNHILDADTKGVVRVEITNSGGLPAEAAPSFKFPPVTGFSGLKDAIKPFRLNPGKTETMEFKVEASPKIASGVVPVKLLVKEGNGFDAQPVVLQLETRAFEAPKLSIEDIKIGGDGMIKAGSPAVVVMTVKNAGGIAWDVAAKFNGTTGVNIGKVFGAGGNDTGVKALSDTSVKIGTLEPGTSKRLELAFQVAPTFKGSKLPLSVALTEKRPRYNMSTLALGLEVSP